MNTTDSAKVSDANAGANNVIHIPHNPTLAGLATLTRNVAYKTGADNLVMDIISPQSTGDDDDRRYPTVAIRARQRLDHAASRLRDSAALGFGPRRLCGGYGESSRCLERPPHMFPAYLEDAKQPSAISGQTRVNGTWTPTVLGIWGHVVRAATRRCWVGLTADDPRYEDGTNADESDAVKYVVSCFPPTDMLEAVDAFDDETNPFRLYYFGPFAAVVGATHETGINAEVRQRAADMSPTCRCGMTNSIRRCSCCTVPPTPWSPIINPSRCATDWSSTAVDAQLVLVDGAEHEYDFWSQQSSTVIFDFIRERS